MLEPFGSSIAILRLQSVGFRPSTSWPSCYYNAKLELFLTVYVDDFKMAGPRNNLKEGRALISNILEIEDPAPIHLYLGCLHEKKKTMNGPPF